MPSLHQILPDSCKEQNNIGSSTYDTCNLEAVLSLNDPERSIRVDEPCSFDYYSFNDQVTNLVRQPSPPPILAEVLDLIPSSQAQLDHSVSEPIQTRALQNELVSIKSPLQLHITHPTQSCFMSSIDVHPHYSYQTMLPEAIAILMAPRDISRTHSIIRLTTPGGMSVIRNCQFRGFHPHDEPPGGGPIYDHRADVYMN